MKIFYLKITLIFINFFIITTTSFAQKENESNTNETKHRSTAWHKAMQKPNANYFAVKNEFDKYFAINKWENSKLREYGEGWIKSSIFYLDKNGFVQDMPNFDKALKANFPKNLETNTTTRTVGTWTMIGPVNSASTGYSSKYNHGGYAFLNRIDPTNSQKMFVSFLTGGLWMTTNAGTDWTLTDANMPNEKYNDIDICRDSPNVVYAIMNSMVSKSVDGGLNWVATALSRPTYSGTAYDIAVSPTNPDIVVARWGTNVYRTINGGTSWSSVKSGLPNYYVVGDCSVQSEMLDWSTTNNNVVYFISTTNNNKLDVYRSDDAGATFSLMTTITLDPAANGQIIGWAKLLLPSNNTSEIYVAIGTGSDSYGHHATQLYKINNTTGAEILKRVNMLTGLTDATGIHHGDIAMDRANENKIVYGTYSPDRVYYSSDNGVSFSISTATHSDLRSLDMVNNNALVGSDGEVAYSTDGGATLTTITNSISNHELWGFGSAFKTDLVASGNNHGPAMAKEDGSGFEWYNLSGADQGNTDVNPLDDRYIYSQGYSNYRYFRTGVHTMINESNFLDAGGIYAYYNSMEFHPNLYYSLITHHAGQYPVGNPNLATWKNSLIKTTDNGASISIVKTFSDQVFREKICMTNPNVMYVVVGLNNNKVWKTTDAGLNWVDVTPSTTESLGQTKISDIAVSDTDPNQVWVTYSSVQATCKVLNSTDGGTSWGLSGTQSTMTTYPNSKILFQRGSDGGVYVGNNSGVYYKNNTMPDWVLLGNGLPLMEIRFMFINYNLGKIRIGTSRGAWEHNLYETSPPKAQISASTNKIACPRDFIQFKDYSTVRNASATWAWSFPGGNPSTSNLENPTVTYEGSGIGTYDVTLTVTDEFGTSTQTLNNFVEITGVECLVDTIPGKLLKLSAPGDYAQQTSPLGINTNTITLSAWIKPNGLQSDAGIIFSGSGVATGFNFRGGVNSNQLGYHWANTGGSYGWTGGPTVPADVWSHVALVITPTNVTIYLNGVPTTKTNNHAAVNFDQIFKFGIDRTNTARNFKGLIDEICIYNRALSTAEIRELMNLTRNNPNTGTLPAVDPSLLAYYQFNEGAGKPSYDKVGINHANLVGAATKDDVSTAPVGGGTFQRINVTSGGLKDFATPGVELTFPNTGTLPNGDIVVSRINEPSDQLANSFVLPDAPRSYFVIRNYGTNSTFEALTSIKFKNIKGTTNAMVTSPNILKLYKRLSNDDGTTWGVSIDDADLVTNTSGVGTIEFSTDLLNTSFSQFSIAADITALPVQLLSFKAKTIENNKVALNWKTMNEVNFKQFEIERAGKDYTFTKIGIKSSATEGNYSYFDNEPQVGINYYRLKMVDADGKFTYSPIKAVDIISNVKVTIAPNPSPDGRVGFKLEGLKGKADINLSITNSAGQLVKSLYLNIENNVQNIIGIDAPGLYIIQITLTDGQVFSQKIIVNNK